MKAVALLSGGLDSTTALAKSLEDGFNEIYAVSCFYGSKHNTRELQSARTIIDWYNSRFGLGVRIFPVEISLPDVFSGGGSALMGEINMPHLTYQEIAEEVGPSPTVVPFRNANLISVATTVAITHGAEAVYVGMHAEDARNWAYPDCTPEFLGAMANAVWVGSYHQVRLVFPLIWLLKSEVVELGTRLKAPLHLTYSCYEGGLKHCGLCPTCVERKEAFAVAGVPDPTAYL